jgi:hypothetical protein
MLPNNMALQQVGIYNVKTYEDYHQLVWINMKLLKPVLIVCLGKPLQLASAVLLVVLLRWQKKNRKLGLAHPATNCTLLQARALKKHGRCVAALLHVSIESVEYSKHFCKEKESQVTVSSSKLIEEKEQISSASTVIIAHIK